MAPGEELRTEPTVLVEQNLLSSFLEQKEPSVLKKHVAGSKKKKKRKKKTKTERENMS